MSADEKTLRTSAFYTNGRGYLYRFWVMSPAYQRPGFQIKEHEKGVNSACTSRIADGLPEKEALKRMGELERDAAATCKRVQGREDDLGPEFRAAIPFADHLDAVVADTICDRLRKRRPGFKLK